MEKIIRTFLLCVCLLGCGLPADACTLWSASGSTVEGGGTLIAKNRDWIPNHYQELRMVNPEKGFKYYGIFAVGGTAAGLRGGINDQGLVIVTAAASCIPSQQRRNITYTNSMISKLLTTCDSVETALEKINSFEGAQFVMFADHKRSAVVEFAPGHQSSIRTTDNGVLYHTNHYLAENLFEYNYRVGESSVTRLNRIEDLLNSVQPPFSMDDFIAFSNDRVAGPDDSIWRTGSTTKKPRTLASWIVYLPKEGSPVLHVKLANPNQDEEVFNIKANDIFADAKSHEK